MYSPFPIDCPFGYLDCEYAHDHDLIHKIKSLLKIKISTSPNKKLVFKN